MKTRRSYSDQDLPLFFLLCVAVFLVFGDLTPALSRTKPGGRSGEAIIRRSIGQDPKEITRIRLKYTTVETYMTGAGRRPHQSVTLSGHAEFFRKADLLRYDTANDETKALDWDGNEVEGSAQFVKTARGIRAPDGLMLRDISFTGSASAYNRYQPLDGTSLNTIWTFRSVAKRLGIGDEVPKSKELIVNPFGDTVVSREDKSLEGGGESMRLVMAPMKIVNEIEGNQDHLYEFYDDGRLKSQTVSLHLKSGKTITLEKNEYVYGLDPSGDTRISSFNETIYLYNWGAEAVEPSRIAKTDVEFDLTSLKTHELSSKLFTFDALGAQLEKEGYTDARMNPPVTFYNSPEERQALARANDPFNFESPSERVEGVLSNSSDPSSELTVKVDSIEEPKQVGKTIYLLLFLGAGMVLTIFIVMRRKT